MPYYFASVCTAADILQLTQAGTWVLASTLKYDCKYAGLPTIIPVLFLYF